MSLAAEMYSPINAHTFLDACPDSPHDTATASRGRSSTLTTYTGTTAGTEQLQELNSNTKQRLGDSIRRISLEYAQSLRAGQNENGGRNSLDRPRASFEFIGDRLSTGNTSTGRGHKRSSSGQTKYVAPPPLEPPSLSAARLAWMGINRRKSTLAEPQSYAPLSPTLLRQEVANDALYHGVQADNIRGSGYSRYPTTSRTTLRVEDQRVKGFRAWWRDLVLSIRLKLFRIKKSVFKQ